MVQENSDLSSDTLSLSGYITKKDFINHNRYHFTRFNRILFIFSFLTFISIFLFYTWNLEENTDFRIFTLILGTSIALIVSSLGFLWGKLVHRIRAANEYKSDQLIKSEISLILSPQEIEQKIRRSTNYYPWSEIIAAYEHKDMFRLYISKNKAILIPKTFFTSQDEMEQLKELVNKNMEKGKIKLL